MIQKLTLPLAVCLLFLLGFTMYANSLSTPFQFDDVDYITDNPSIRDGIDPDTLWKSRWSKGRFLVFWSFAANYALGGLEPVGYHVVNVLIHILAAMAVWWLARLLLESSAVGSPVRADGRPPLQALFVALLFLCHPIQTESVTYISQRFTGMATLFYVLSMCFYITGRRRNEILPFMASALCAIGAMFSKEIAITLPINILLYEYYFMTDDAVGARSPRPPRKGGGTPPLRIILPVLAFALIIPALFRFDILNILTIEHVSGSHEGDRLTPLTYFLTQSRVIIRYLGLLFFPAGAHQNILHDVPMSRSLIDPPTTLLSFLALGALFFWAIRMGRRGRSVGAHSCAPLLSYGIIWFFLCLSVESSFITIRHVMFEHRLYLPSIGIFMAVSAAIMAYRHSHRTPARIGMVILVTTLCALTIQRNQIWRSPITLWQDAAAKSPRLIKPHAHLGLAYLEARDFGKSLAAYNAALRINPRDARLYYNRAITHYTMGYWQKALEDYSTTIKIAPDFLRAYYNRGNIYGKHEQFEEALRDFTTVIDLDGTHLAALNNRGIIYLKMNKPLEALADYTRILSQKPDSLMALIHRGNTYWNLKEYDHALVDYASALRVEPRSAKVYWLRASLYKELGRTQEAQADAQKVMELTTDGGRNFHRSGDPNNDFVDLVPGTL